MSLKVHVNGGPSEEYSYALGQLIRNNESVFFCLEAFQVYIMELQRVHDFYKLHEETINKKNEQTKEGF
jgi:hypothetical protein